MGIFAMYWIWNTIQIARIFFYTSLKSLSSKYTNNSQSQTTGKIMGALEYGCGKVHNKEPPDAPESWNTFVFKMFLSNCFGFCENSLSGSMNEFVMCKSFRIL